MEGQGEYVFHELMNNYSESQMKVFVKIDND